MDQNTKKQEAKINLDPYLPPCTLHLEQNAIPNVKPYKGLTESTDEYIHDTSYPKTSQDAQKDFASK